MLTTSVSRWLAAFTLVLGLTTSALAQPPRLGDRPLGPRDRYVQFPIDPKYEEKLKERLAMENQLEPFKDLVRKMLADPKMLLNAKDQVKDLKVEDPDFKKAIQDWFKNDPQLRKSLLEWIQQNPPEKQQPEDVVKLQKDLKQLIGDADKEAPKPVAPVKPIEPVHSSDDAMRKLTESAIKQAENSQFADWLRHSPAWKRAFEDMRGSFENRDALKNASDNWSSKLFAPDGVAWRFAEGTLDKLREAPRPRLDRLGRDLTLPGVGRIPLPDLGPPGAGDLHGPSFGTIGTVATWLLGAIILLLIVARLARWPRRGRPVAFERPNLGPWPVRPESVATRAELVLAFDYLALWTLGLRVKSWNHNAVAALWHEQAPACTASASELARLYESARYTDGVELLSESDRDRARQSLLQIAEAL